MFETNREPYLQIERCDECDRFPDDRTACAHVLGLIAEAMFGPNHCHLVRLLSSGGTPLQWEELAD